MFATWSYTQRVTHCWIQDFRHELQSWCSCDFECSIPEADRQENVVRCGLEKAQFCTRKASHYKTNMYCCRCQSRLVHLSFVSVNSTCRRTRGSYLTNASFWVKFLGFFFLT